MASTTTLTAPPASATTTSTRPSSQPTRLPPETSTPKPTPYTYSLSYLCATDPNPLPPSSKLMSLPRPQLNEQLQTIARDGTQSLITSLLTTTTIHSTSDGVSMLLPQISNVSTSTADKEVLRLPRWKPLPKQKEPTKWETFAKKKGIGKYGNAASGGAKLEERRKNMVYDEESGEWVKKWGYKGKNMKEGQEWLVEVDDDKKRKAEEEGENVRTEGKRERMERMRRQERRERNNQRKRGKVGG